MLTSLFKQLTLSSAIVTANKRASVYLLQQHSDYQQQLGHTVWPSVDILPLSSWITRCWQEAAETGASKPDVLLSQTQEQALWEQMIQHSPLGEQLLKITPTAMLAQEAWHLLKQWQVALTSLQTYPSEDTQAFLEWTQQFQAYCEQHHWIDLACATDILIEQISSTPLPLPDQIFFVGFDEITPQLQRLFTALKQRNCHTQLINFQYPNPQLQQLGLADTETELYTMARWAKHLVTATSSPVTIGCVIPNLNSLRSQVERVFIEVFNPSVLQTGHTPNFLPFNISTGQALSHYPLIHTALLTLALGRQTIAADDCSALLRSPFFIGADAEINQRAQLDVALKALNERTIDIRNSLIPLSTTAPIWAKHLHAAINLFTHKKPHKATSSQWANLIKQVLAAFGWPGDRKFTSHEYQLLEQWSHLLEEFAHLDHFYAEIEFEQAVKQLEKLAAAMIYQPQGAEVPIQIMGYLEASGLQFDYLWVMGLSDDVWPPVASPNPFLPRALQNRLQMPHSSAEQELQFTRTVTQRLCHSAPYVILSYPQQEQDRSLRPSPLLKTIPEVSLEMLALPDYTSYSATLQQAGKLETFADHQAPALQDVEIPKGGTAIFKHQAACPFRAFAILRLNAKNMDVPKTGLSPTERGSLIHHALEEFWKNVSNHQQLSALSETALATTLGKAIASALHKLSKKRPTTLKKRFTSIEQQRLQRLLTSWLTLERQRQPFTVVATEYRTEVTVAGIPITLQIDRIDELANGCKIIIDYKTTFKPSINDWLGERPDEPQLPLYCVANHEPISGILFAQLRAETLKFLGITALKDCIPGVLAIDEYTHPGLADSWERQLVQWQQTLEKLAQEFNQGVAKVNPKNLLTTCNFCDLTPFCRIHEQAVAAVDGTLHADS